MHEYTDQRSLLLVKISQLPNIQKNKDRDKETFTTHSHTEPHTHFNCTPFMDFNFKQIK